MLKGWWRQIATAVDEGALSLISSPQAIDELSDVVQRPRFSQLITPADAVEIADLLRRAEMYQPMTILPICRDPNDDYLLALAQISAADMLDTRDEDLLVLRQLGRTEIIHVSEFLTRISTAR